MRFLLELGAYAPLLLILLSWFLLWGHPVLSFYYSVGLFANAVLNLVFKGIVQEPRPMFDPAKVKLLKTHGKHFFYQNGIPFDVFGMPSGHAQASLFSAVFVFLALRQTNVIFYLYAPLSLLTCFQRVHDHYHSPMQVLVGAVAGSAFAYLVYQLAREKMKNKMREKPDDGAPP